MSLLKRIESSDDNYPQRQVRSTAVQEPETLKQALIQHVLENAEGWLDVSNREATRAQFVALMDAFMDEREKPDESAPPQDTEQRRLLYQSVLDEILGFGPLQPLLDDDTITEVLVASRDRVFTRRGDGHRERTEVRFDDDEHLRRIVDRMTSYVGKRPLGNRWFSTRLQSGWLVHANWVVADDAFGDLSGTTLSLYRMRPPMLTPQAHVDSGVLTQDMLEYLQAAVQSGRRIIIAGRDANAVSGLLYLLSSFLADRTFVVAVEDSYKIKLGAPDVVKMQLPPRFPWDKRHSETFEAEAAAFVGNVLNLNPDALIVSELNVFTCEPLLWATVPSIATLHSPSAEHTVNWLLHHGKCRDAAALASRVGILVQVGAPYRVTEICELDGAEPGLLQRVFVNTATQA